MEQNLKSTTLAAIIVANRTLGFNEEQSIRAMQELYRRKLSGDTFDYQAFIDAEVKKVPKLKADEPSTANFLAKILENVKKAAK